MAQTQPTVQAGSGPLAPGPLVRPEIPEVALEAELGRGGMGVVYRGRQTYLDRAVAVKVLKPGIGGDEFSARFRREATLLAGLAHPHIVACHHAGALADGACFLVMEFIDGPNLSQHVRANGPLAPEAVVQVIRSIAEALRYAQGKGIIHRDVKTENILLAPGGSATFPFTAKLVDLGLARPVAAVGDAAMTRQGVILGTPSTMAPEQFDDPEGVDHRADMYGLGCAAYQALTGEAAFRGSSLVDIVSAKASGQVPDPQTLRRDCPPALAALIRRLLARRREDRFATYDELIAACADLAGGASAPVARKRPLLLVGAAVVVVVVGALLLRGGDALPVASEPPVTPQPTEVTAPIPPSETAAPAPEAPSAPAPITAWKPWEPLHGEEPVTGLAGWDRTAGWGLAEEESGLIGHSRERAVLRRPISTPAWRVRGRFGPVGAADYHEAGVQVLTSASDCVQCSVRNLGPTRFLVVERLAADGSVRDRLHFAALTSEPPWDVRCTVVGSTLEWAVADQSGSGIDLGSPANGFALVVQGGAVHVQELALSEPVAGR